MPQRIAELLRELHRRLRDPGRETGPRSNGDHRLATRGMDERS
jgi:hypothetical protein